MVTHQMRYCVCKIHATAGESASDHNRTAVGSEHIWLSGWRRQKRGLSDVVNSIHQRILHQHHCLPSRNQGAQVPWSDKELYTFELRVDVLL
jgi:hypothetical protein